jgi:DNA-binding IclR family transcriptional regulator
MHIAGILLAFNEADHLAVTELKDTTQLPESDLLKLLKLLTDARIIVSPVSF